MPAQCRHRPTLWGRLWLKTVSAENLHKVYSCP